MQQNTADDQVMIRYLLGGLSEEERLQFEDHYAKDEEYFDQLLAIEDDLIQEYVRDELTAAERRRFEEYFLISPQRREKVKRASALLQVIQKQPRMVAEASRFAEAIREVWQRSKSGLKFLLNPNPAVSFAILIVGAIIGGRWIYLTTENLHTKLGQFDQERAALLEANQELRQQIAQQRIKLDDALQNESSWRAQLEKKWTELRPRAASVAFALFAYDSQRGPEGGAETLNLAIPRSADSVRLQLGLKNADYKSYRAILETTANEEILWSQDVLPTPSSPGNKVIVLALPALIFGDGEYALKLHGFNAAGALEETSNVYFFRTKLK